MDAMNGRTLERRIAKPLLRDGCINVVVQGGHRDRSVTSPEVQKFITA
ncbi:hypothetical protein [Streptomyces sp. NPDC059861]